MDTIGAEGTLRPRPASGGTLLPLLCSPSFPGPRDIFAASPQPLSASD